MEAGAKGEAERVAEGLTGSDAAPDTDGRAERSRPAGAGLLAGRGARERTHRGAAGAWLLALTGQHATRARTVTRRLPSYARPPVQRVRIRHAARTKAATCALGANHGRSQRVILLRSGAPTADSACISAVPPGVATRRLSRSTRLSGSAPKWPWQRPAAEVACNTARVIRLTLRAWALSWPDMRRGPGVYQ